MAADLWAAPVTPEDARAAVTAAIRAAGANHQILVADLGLRLARLGYLKDVRVNVADGAAAARAAVEAVRSVLSELAAPPQALALENARSGADVAQPVLAPSDPLEPLQSRNAGRCECGLILRQGDRQTKRRLFCSTRCRVRHHRSLTSGLPRNGP